jgi:hypothetical protein
LRQNLSRVILAVPALLALILAAPCLHFTFISDDFTFLQRARTFSLAQLLPDARAAFYRPISRELYFGFLTLLGGNNPLWGHLLNALLLAVAVTLVAVFARRLGGEMLGTLSGAFLAGLGATPLLVGWVSCAQDLFAMIFLGAALNFEARGRRLLSLASMAAALLSKESAVFFLPALVMMRPLISGDRSKLKGSALRYAALVAVWGVVHPKIQALFLHGFSTGEGGYVGLDNPRVLRSALRMAGTLVNIPPTGLHTPWLDELTPALFAALLVLGLVPWIDRKGSKPPSEHTLPDRTIVWIGILAGVLPAVLTVASAKHWFPYYACLPAIGTSILLALPFRRASWRLAFVPAALFLVLGVRYRGTDAGKATLPAEANFRAASACLRKVEGAFRKLHPQLPDSARLYVTGQMPEETGMAAHLVGIQAVRTWYQNSTLVTMPAEYQDSTRWPRYLFWLNPACQVFEIRLPELRVRSPGPKPDYREYQRAMRSYALGAWAAGDVDRAVGAFLNMQEIDRLSWDFDRRLAAATLLASGRPTEAAGLLKQLPALGREQALDGVCAALTPGLPRAGLYDPAFRVFGLDPSDAEAYRYLMFYFSDRVLLDKAKRMAERLLALRPGDEEATAMLDAISKVPKWEAVLVPVEGQTAGFSGAY